MAMERWRPSGSGLRWEPAGYLGEIQAEVNRLFDSFFGRPTSVSMSELMWMPVVDVQETENELIVSCDLPGVREKDVNVSITGDVLTVKGERKAQNEVGDENRRRLERWHGKFERHVTLPVPVQADRVKATYRDGVLEIRLPKVEEIKPKEIKIEVA